MAYLSMSRSRASLAYAVLAGLLIVSLGVFWHEPLRQSLDHVKDFDIAAGYRFVTGSGQYSIQGSLKTGYGSSLTEHMQMLPTKRLHQTIRTRA